MTAHVTWQKGGEAWVLAASQDAITLRSSIPSPPGSRIDGVVVAQTPDAEEAPPAPLRVKVHASRKQEDGTFRIEGRPLDMTRELRARLEALAATSASRASGGEGDEE